jgi:hypothetical protein
MSGPRAHPTKGPVLVVTITVTKTGAAKHGATPSMNMNVYLLQPAQLDETRTK